VKSCAEPGKKGCEQTGATDVPEEIDVANLQKPNDHDTLKYYSSLVDGMYRKSLA
jgi:hypothetical protein